MLDKDGTSISTVPAQFSFWYVTSANVDNSEYWSTLKQGAEDGARLLRPWLSDYQFFDTDKPTELERVQQQVGFLECALRVGVDIVATTCVVGEDEPDEDARAVGVQLVAAIRALLDSGTTVLTVDTTEMDDDRIETFFGPRGEDLGRGVASTAKAQGYTSAIVFVVAPQYGALRRKVSGAKQVYEDAVTVELDAGADATATHKVVGDALATYSADSTTALIFVQLDGLEAGVLARNEYEATSGGLRPGVFVTDRGSTTDAYASDIEHALGFNQYWMGAQPLQWGVHRRSLYVGTNPPWKGGNDASWSVSITTKTKAQRFFNEAGGWGFLVNADEATVTEGLSAGWLANIGTLSESDYVTKFVMAAGQGWSWVQRKMLPSEVLDQGDTQLCSAYALINLLTYAHARTNRGTSVQYLHPLKIGFHVSDKPFVGKWPASKFQNYYDSTGTNNVTSWGGLSGSVASLGGTGSLDPDCVFAWIRAEAASGHFPLLVAPHTLVDCGFSTTTTRILNVPRRVTKLNATDVRAEARRWMHLLSYGPIALKASCLINSYTNQTSYQQYYVPASSGTYLLTPSDTSAVTPSVAKYSLTVLFADASAIDRFRYTHTLVGWSVRLGTTAVFDATVVERQEHWYHYGRTYKFAAFFEVDTASTDLRSGWATGDSCVFTDVAGNSYTGVLSTRDQVRAAGYTSFATDETNEGQVVSDVPDSCSYGHFMCATGVLWYDHPSYTETRPFLKIKNSWGSSWGTDEYGVRQHYGSNGYVLVDLWSPGRGFGPLDIYAEGAFTFEDTSVGGFNDTPIAPNDTPVGITSFPAVVYDTSTHQLSVDFVVDKVAAGNDLAALLFRLQYQVDGQTSWTHVDFGASVVHVSGGTTFRLTTAALVSLVPFDKANQTYTVRLRVYDEVYSNVSTYDERGGTFVVTNSSYVAVDPPRVARGVLKLVTPTVSAAIYTGTQVPDRDVYRVQFDVYMVSVAIKTAATYEWEITTDSTTSPSTLVTGEFNAPSSTLTTKLTVREDLTEALSKDVHSVDPVDSGTTSVPVAIRAVGGQSMQVQTLREGRVRIRARVKFTDATYTDWSAISTTTNKVRDSSGAHGGYLNEYTEYANNTDKWWVLQGRSKWEYKGQVIGWVQRTEDVGFAMTHFDTEKNWDYLTVYNASGVVVAGGTTKTMSGMFTLPSDEYNYKRFGGPAYLSASGPLYLRFKADSSVTKPSASRYPGRSGFALRFYTAKG